MGKYRIEDLVEAINFYNMRRRACVKIDKPSLKTDSPYQIEPCAFAYINMCTRKDLTTPLGIASFEITDNLPGGLEIKKTRLHVFPLCADCVERTKDFVRRDVRRMAACDVWPFVFTDRSFASAADYFTRYIEGLVMMRMVLTHSDQMELRAMQARKASVAFANTDPALEAELRYNGKGNFDDIMRLVEE